MRWSVGADFRRGLARTALARDANDAHNQRIARTFGVTATTTKASETLP